MAEYIEKEVFLADIDAAMDNAGMGYVVGQTLKRYVKRQPAADVVEVVRCGQCRYEGTGDCPMSGTPGMVSASDFCSYGERGDGHVDM